MTNREEVAGKLRRIEEDVDYETAFMEIDTIIGTKDNYSFSFFFNRLADLIDPTCHVTDEEVTHEPTLNALAVHVYECDKCGWYFYMAEVCCHPKPFYCPHCGARVVQDDRR